MENLEELNITGGSVGDALVNGSKMDNLRRLTIHDFESTRWFADIADGALPSLNSLTVTLGSLSEEHIKTFFHSERLWDFEFLFWNSAGFPPSIWEDFPERNGTAKLQLVDPFASGADVALLRSPAVGLCVRLELWLPFGQPFAQEDVAGLAENPAASSLRSLTLPHLRLTQPTIEALARSPYLSNLVVLSIEAENSVNDEVWDALRDAPFAGSIRYLRLVGTFSRDCLNKLTNPVYFPKLRRIFTGLDYGGSDPWSEARKILVERFGHGVR